MIDAGQLWAEKYAARHALAKQAEDRARSIAFIDTTFLVCGEELRAPTASDLLQLDLSGSFFVGYSATTKEQAEHVARLVWLLHRDNHERIITEPRTLRGRLTKWALFRRLRRYDFETAMDEVEQFMDSQFQDSPARCTPTKEGSHKPIGASFMASLIIRLAFETGWGEREIAAMPLSRLFQYIKLTDARNMGADFKDFSASDKLLSDYLDEVNHHG